MKFLADQDVYQITIDFLRKLGQDIVCIRDVGLSTPSDRELLAWAHQNQRILITRDKDFGALVFLSHQKNPGVIFLRIEPSTIESTHNELSVFLKKHENLNLQNYFCVIEPGYHRIRLTQH